MLSWALYRQLVLYSPASLNPGQCGYRCENGPPRKDLFLIRLSHSVLFHDIEQVFAHNYTLLQVIASDWQAGIYTLYTPTQLSRNRTVYSESLWLLLLGLGMAGDSQRLPKMETREKHLLIQGMAHYAVAQRRSQLKSI